MYDKQKLEELADSVEQWEKTTLQKSKVRFPERRSQFDTTSGEPIKRLYTPLDVADLDYASDLGNPGQYPYTRGIHASLYRGRPWTMRMFAGFGSAEETNKRYKYLLTQGNMGLSVAFDLPTLMGYDSDDPEALGEFGKCGVAVSSLRDMEILFDGIPLDQVSTSMYRSKGIHLPSKTIDAPCRGHHRIRHQISTPVEYHINFRLPYQRGWLNRGTGTGFHFGGWSGVCTLGSRTRPKY